MPTAITHAFVAAAAGAVCFGVKPGPKFWILAVACSAGPDLDIGLHAYGVEYEDLWGHRGMTHSLFFAAVLSPLLVTTVFRREASFLGRSWWALVAFFFGVTASHGFLDAFTDGGLGIAFLSPFDATRYFMPWQPMRVSNFGVASLFTAYGGTVLLSEMLWVWLPVSLLALPLAGVRRARERRPSTRASTPTVP